MGQKNWVGYAVEQVKEIVDHAVIAGQKAEKIGEGEIPAYSVETPSDSAHGDFAVNIAMMGAKVFRMAPLKIGQIVMEEMKLQGTLFSRVEIAGPGFINFFLKPEWFVSVVETILALGKDFGKTDFGGGEKVMVEFVSANPTGPMHLGNARGAVIGDSLAAAIDAAGFNGYREFYLNDAGNQIEKFKTSLSIRYIQQIKGEDAIEFPEDGYQGEDITTRAKEYIALYGDNLIDKTEEERGNALSDYALPLNIAAMENTLDKYRVVYDRWFRESSLYEDGSVEKIMEILKSKDLSYGADGAVWYKATAFGEQKDEVLIRQNGTYTYFAADIAYHYNKFAVRGFKKVIDVWGADHHGHVARMKNAMDAVGLNGENLEIVLMQLVRLLKDGEPYRMSKRSGKSVTLDDLLELVSVDAARFFFNMRESRSAMDFDLDLAVEQTSKNPVYYVQYAHARIHSILRNLKNKGIAVEESGEKELLLLNHPSELALIRKLAELPSLLITVATRYETAPLTHYAVEVANAFHKFYDDCRILVEDTEKDWSLMQGRIALCNAARITIYNTLDILKISAPEAM